VALHLLLSLHLPEEIGADVRGLRPELGLSESDRLCAGSVDSTAVRSPASAQRRAVAAAMLVFPTPPFPV